MDSPFYYQSLFWPDLNVDFASTSKPCLALWARSSYLGLPIYGPGAGSSYLGLPIYGPGGLANSA